MELTPVEGARTRMFASTFGSAGSSVRPQITFGCCAGCRCWYRSSAACASCMSCWGVRRGKTCIGRLGKGATGGCCSPDHALEETATRSAPAMSRCDGIRIKTPVQDSSSSILPPRQNVPKLRPARGELSPRTVITKDTTGTKDTKVTQGRWLAGGTMPLSRRYTAICP